jgi:hypothetical protein
MLDHKRLSLKARCAFRVLKQRKKKGKSSKKGRMKHKANQSFQSGEKI